MLSRINCVNINLEELSEYLRLNVDTGKQLDIERADSDSSTLSAEVAALIVGGMSSTVALVSVIFNYYVHKRIKGEIVITASDGKSIRFPSDISGEEKSEIMNLLKEMQHLQITLRNSGEG